MKSVIIRDAEFRKISESRNLRGVREYSRKHRVERIDIYENNDGTAQLGIAWADGATCITDFASHAVCKHWVGARRAFASAQVVHHKRGETK